MPNSKLCIAIGAFLKRYGYIRNVHSERYRDNYHYNYPAVFNVKVEMNIDSADPMAQNLHGFELTNQEYDSLEELEAFYDAPAKPIVSTPLDPKDFTVEDVLSVCEDRDAYQLECDRLTHEVNEVTRLNVTVTSERNKLQADVNNLKNSPETKNLKAEIEKLKKALEDTRAELAKYDEKYNTSPKNKTRFQLLEVD